MFANSSCQRMFGEGRERLLVSLLFMDEEHERDVIQIKFEIRANDSSDQHTLQVFDALKKQLLLTRDQTFESTHAFCFKDYIRLTRTQEQSAKMLKNFLVHSLQNMELHHFVCESR